MNQKQLFIDTPVGPVPAVPTDEPETIQDRFERFHERHPEVFELFERFAREKKSQGFKRYSSDALLARVRWECEVAHEDGEPFKVNDHYSSRYSRLLIQKCPEFQGFFELRQLKAE